MDVGIDANGYAYDLATGFNVSLCYDEDGNAFDCSSGESIGSVTYDSGGSQQTVYNNQPNWPGVVSQISGAVFRPASPYPVGGVRATGVVNPSGIGTSLNVSTNTLMLIAGGVLIFLVAKGRR